MENELGSHVVYMFDMVKAGRPDFQQHARIDLSKPLRQYIGGAAFHVRVDGFQRLKPEIEAPGPVAIM